MKYYKLEDITVGNNLIKDKLESLKKAKKIPVRLGKGQILYEDIVALKDHPEFNRSTVDGYGIRSLDTRGMGESFSHPFKVVGSVPIGEIVEFTTSNLEVVEVVTGSYVPKDFDAVIMVEDTDIRKDGEILVRNQLGNLENIMSRGEDLKCGEIIFPKGHQLRASDVSILMGLGIEEISVYDVINVGLFSTGNELISDHKDYKLGKIFDYNGPLIEQYLMDVPYINLIRGKIILDGIAYLEEELDKVCDTVDLILISGGSSIGIRDYTLELIEKRGEVFLHGLPIKPGKPTIFGKYRDTLIFGLPGQPVSCFFVFKEIFLNNYLSKNEVIGEYPLLGNLDSKFGRLDFVPVVLEEKMGRTMVLPVLGKSGTMSWIKKAQGYIIIPRDLEGVREETMVSVINLN